MKNDNILVQIFMGIIGFVLYCTIICVALIWVLGVGTITLIVLSSIPDIFMEQFGWFGGGIISFILMMATFFLGMVIAIGPITAIKDFVSNG